MWVRDPQAAALPSPSGLPHGAMVTMVPASERAGVGPVPPAGPGALGPRQATHLAVAGARLVHEGAVLTGPHGGRGRVRGAPDGAVLMEARKLHSNGTCGWEEKPSVTVQCLRPSPRALPYSATLRQTATGTDGALGRLRRGPGSHTQPSAQSRCLQNGLNPTATLLACWAACGFSASAPPLATVWVAASLGLSSTSCQNTLAHISVWACFHVSAKNPEAGFLDPSK